MFGIEFIFPNMFKEGVFFYFLDKFWLNFGLFCALGEHLSNRIVEIEVVEVGVDLVVDFAALFHLILPQLSVL